MRLDSPIDYPDYPPAYFPCCPPNVCAPLRRLETVIVGLGASSVSSTNVFEYPEIIQIAEVDIVCQLESECTKNPLIYGRPASICVQRNGKSPCSADSGNMVGEKLPLSPGEVIQRYMIWGVCSYGAQQALLNIQIIENCGKGDPSGYTSTGFVSKWIAEKTGEKCRERF